MSKTISIDDEVAQKIAEKARPFESRNDVLRRMFKLPRAERKRGRPRNEERLKDGRSS